jgi:hypothetical protein
VLNTVMNLIAQTLSIQTTLKVSKPY